MRKKRGKIEHHDLSNRAVVLVLILVMLASILSLGIYISTVQSNTTLSGGAILTIDMTKEPSLNSLSLEENNLEDKNGPTFQ